MNFIDPMLLDSCKEPFNSENHIFEPKSNGIRLELLRSESQTKLITRHGTDVTKSLPELLKLDLSAGTILDGELVCYSPHNPLEEDFEAVMSRIVSKSEKSVKQQMSINPCNYIVFDILMYRNKPLMDLPLVARKQILESKVSNQSYLQKVMYLRKNGNQLFEVIKKHKLEGIVAKRIESRYHAGKRPVDVWTKIINWRYSDCLISGFRKEQTGWYLEVIGGEGIGSKGFVEFGISKEMKQLFYEITKKMVVKEDKKSVWIQKILKCEVKHRGVLKSGNLMTPVFVKFLIDEIK
ncbi:ATP-dependent DNA ligase [Paenibacillus sp. GCM10027627]|uniref:ATP-dependent DNA ligase n=1 Tax=unclassified Paenibacillus TaxID=185978 RepID=UPI00362F4E74